VKSKDQVTSATDDRHARIGPAQAKVDSIYRSILALKEHRSDKELVAIAVEEHVRRVVQERRDQ